MQLISHKLFYESYREKLPLVLEGVKNNTKIFENVPPSSDGQLFVADSREFSVLNLAIL